MLTGAIGVVTSVAMMIVSAFIPRWFVSKAEHQLDVVRLRGRIFSKQESSILGVLLHIVFSLFFGVVFGVGMSFGIFSLQISSMAVYFVAMSLVLGGIVLPIEGHGLFGWREDHWIPVDLLAMNVLWIFIFWALLIVLI